jgi:ketosteroid isomerase-like protein
MQREALKLAAALCASYALAHAADLEEQIRSAEKSWSAAVVAGDHAALDRMYGDHLVYTHSTGIVENKSEYMTRLRSGKQKYEAIDFDSMNIHTYGNAAVSACKVRMRGTSNGKPFNDTLLLTHIWVKQSGSWHLVSHQTTKVPVPSGS